MKSRSRVLTAAALSVLPLAVLAAYPGDGPDGQYRTAADHLTSPWENNRVRLSRISVEPGATLPAGGNRVLVHFTADADGRMPPAAVWQPAGAAPLTNQGPARLDALVIDLKDGPQGPWPGTPPEALDAYSGVDVTPLVDNVQVFVARQRYDPGNYGGPPHSHPEDVILVYLRGGDAWPADGYPWATRFRRGELEIVPARTIHRVANAGPDPLEVLVVIPK